MEQGYDKPQKPPFLSYGFLRGRSWARKLGVVISIPPAIGTLAAALGSPILGLINSALVTL